MTREEELKKELKEIKRLKHNIHCKHKAEEKRRAAGIPRRTKMSKNEVVKRRAHHNSIRYKTLEGKLKRIYNSQLRNSRHRGHSKPEYTLDEFIDKYITNSVYKKLHAQWVESNYEKALAPSFDRLDDTKGYSFDNLQIVTWKRNSTKAHEDMRSGKLINAHKVIYQYKDGKTIEYSSASEASKITGISAKAITNVVTKNAKATRDGSLWVRNIEDILDAQVANSKAHMLSKTVLQYNMNGDLIATHRNTREAAENVGLKSSSNIRAVCDGRRKQSGGFIWRYT